MTNGLNIFCNNNIKIFLHSLFSEYELNIMKVKSILISQPKPEIKNSPYVELIKKFKLNSKI